MIREANVDDVTEIHALIRELAAYEREPDQAKATPEQLRDALFGAHPAVFGLVAEDDTGAVVGFALWFRNFSTWTGTHGIYLEDLYVRPAARGAGHGRALLAELAAICEARGYQRLEWSVLNWNAPARAFYRALGAVSMDEWTVNRVSGDALKHLASRAG